MKIRKWIKWICITISILLIILLVGTRFISFKMDDEEIKEAFAKIGHEPLHLYETFDEGQLHYVAVGDTNMPVLMLLHGSPGSWDNWVPLLTSGTILDNYFIIAVDRIPYNGTSIKGSYSLAQQSAFLSGLVSKYCQPCLVTGHSYGGALALQMALDYDSEISTVISIAGTNAAPYQETRWYNYIARYTPVRWLIHPELMDSNREMWRLEKDLPILNTGLKNFRSKLVLIQGGKDFLVDPRSLEFVESLVPQMNVHFYFKEEADHFMIWTDKEYVEGIINELVKD